MKTDYQNLNAFESSVVVFIAAGVLLLAVLAFSGLGVKQQDGLANAANILDVNRQVSQSAESLNTILVVTQEFYSQFYVAFSQVATFPEGYIDVTRSYFRAAYNGLAEYSARVANEYKLNSAPKHQFAYGSMVAGAVIDLTNLLNERPVTTYQASLDPPEANIPYSFEPFQWQPVKQEIIKIWSE